MNVGLIGQGAGGIDAVEPAHARRHETGPAAVTTAHVEPLGISRQPLPRGNGEVIAKDALGFAEGHALLIEALPLFAEARDGSGVEWGGGIMVIGGGGQRQIAESSQ